MIIVYFIRHFPTQSNIKNIWCGRGTDISINRDISIKLLKDDLLNEIGQIKFNFVFTSPLKRCIETCNMLGIKKFCVDQRLIEREFGSIEQKPCNEKDKRNLGDWELNTDLGAGVEKIQDLYNGRVVPFMSDLKKLPQDSNVLVVSHSWIGRLFKYYFSKNQDDILVAPKNGKITKFVL